MILDQAFQRAQAAVEDERHLISALVDAHLMMEEILGEVGRSVQRADQRLVVIELRKDGTTWQVRRPSDAIS